MVLALVKRVFAIVFFSLFVEISLSPEQNFYFLFLPIIGYLKLWNSHLMFFKNLSSVIIFTITLNMAFIYTLAIFTKIYYSTQQGFYISPWAT